MVIKFFSPFLCMFWMFSLILSWLIAHWPASCSSDILSKLNRFFGIKDEKSAPVAVLLISRIWLFSPFDVSLMFVSSCYFSGSCVANFSIRAWCGVSLLFVSSKIAFQQSLMISNLSDFRQSMMLVLFSSSSVTMINFDKLQDCSLTIFDFSLCVVVGDNHAGD